MSELLEPTAKDIAGIPAQWWLRLGHDLRGPIAPIRMALQLLRGNGMSGADRDDTLKLMDRQIDVLLAGIDDVSELLRIHAGTLLLREEVGDLATLLDLLSGRGALRTMLDDRGLGLDIQAPGEPILARHDPQRLLLVIEFLLRKAAAHAMASHVSLRLERDGSCAMWTLGGLGAGFFADQCVGLVTGGSSDFLECDARAVLARELSRLLGLRFRTTPDSLVLSMELGQ